MSNWLDKQSKDIDICLIVEGSYPYVHGGVSAWTHKVIQAFPEYRFGIIFLGSLPQYYVQGPKYKLPPNVVYFAMHYLFNEKNSPVRRVKANPENFACMAEFHHLLREDRENPQGIAGDLNFYLDPNKKITEEQFLYSEASWDYITEQYSQFSTEPSFIDYFWTVKNIHQPLWLLPKIIETLPPLKVIHTLSTGYAGFLGALLHDRFGYPLILSEHGIYTKERRVEIISSGIFRDINFMQEDIVNISYLRTLWNNFFESLAKTCYAAAEPIVSLFEGAHHIQLEYGVDDNKTAIIPNGIDVEHYDALVRSFDEKPQPIIGFIGRIVSIKDVKTLIRSMVLVKQAVEDVQLWIMGSAEEEPQYVLECEDLIISLDLQDSIRIMPNQDLAPIFPQLKVVALSSISEGMPLVVLEANAAGIPVVATDVGACRELIEGRTGEDAALGKSGRIVRIADPEGLAKALTLFLSDAHVWREASDAGRARVKKYYEHHDMIERYRDIYSAGLDQWQA